MSIPVGGLVKAAEALGRVVKGPAIDTLKFARKDTGDILDSGRISLTKGLEREENESANAANATDNLQNPPEVSGPLSRVVDKTEESEDKYDRANKIANTVVPAVAGKPKRPEPRGIPEQVKGREKTFAKGGSVEPTDGQKAAGNYAKEHRMVAGMRVSVENKAGTVRRGTAPDGSDWSQQMQNDYGYIRGTKGADKDHIDAFFGPHDASTSPVHVIDQVHPDTGNFDEHKVVFGTQTPEEALGVYHANYEPGWKGADSVRQTDMKSFKDWAFSKGAKRKPYADGGPVETDTLKNDDPGTFDASYDPSSYASKRLNELDNIFRGTVRGVTGAFFGAPGSVEQMGRDIINLSGLGHVNKEPVLPNPEYVRSVLPITPPSDPTGRLAEYISDFTPLPGGAPAKGAGYLTRTALRRIE